MIWLSLIHCTNAVTNEGFPSGCRKARSGFSFSQYSSSTSRGSSKSRLWYFVSHMPDLIVDIGSLLFSSAAWPADQHTTDSVKGNKMPVRPFPEFLFNGRLPSVHLPTMGTDVLCFQYANADVEPRAVLRNCAAPILANELAAARTCQRNMRGCVNNCA